VVVWGRQVIAKAEDGTLTRAERGIHDAQKLIGGKKEAIVIEKARKHRSKHRRGEAHSGSR